MESATYRIAQAASRILRRLEFGGTTLGVKPTIHGRVFVRGPGKVTFGERVVLDGSTSPIEFVTGPGAEIRIGDDVWIGSGASFEALEQIALGNRVTVSAFCKVLDNHLHLVTGDRGEQPASQAVHVGDDVWLGPRAVLLAGARIGARSVVGPATVVPRAIPPDCEARGAPLKIARIGTRGSESPQRSAS